VVFTAQSLAVLVKISWALFEDTAPESMSTVEDSFAKVLGLELDRAALRGSGSAPEPGGIRNQTGVTLTSHGTNGSTIGSPPSATVIGWEFLVDALATVRSANFEPNAQIMAPRTSQKLSQIRDTTN
jgi:HK97 family phage major capsid protein